VNLTNFTFAKLMPSARAEFGSFILCRSNSCHFLVVTVLRIVRFSRPRLHSHQVQMKKVRPVHLPQILQGSGVFSLHHPGGSDEPLPVQNAITELELSVVLLRGLRIHK